MDYKTFLDILYKATDRGIVFWDIDQKKAITMEGMGRLYRYKLEIDGIKVYLIPGYKMNPTTLDDEDTLIFSIEAWNENIGDLVDDLEYNALTSDPKTCITGVLEPSPMDVFTLYLLVRREWMYRYNMERYYAEYSRRTKLVGDSRDLIPLCWDISGKIHISNNWPVH